MLCESSNKNRYIETLHVTNRKTVFKAKLILVLICESKHISSISPSNLPPSRNFSGIRLNKPKDWLNDTNNDEEFRLINTYIAEQSKLISGPETIMMKFLYPQGLPIRSIVSPWALSSSDLILCPQSFALTIWDISCIAIHNTA